MQSQVIAVLLMAAVAYLPRIIPLVTITHKIDNIFVQSFLHYVPFAVLGALTFPDIFYSTDKLTAAVSGTLAALFLASKEKSLVTVAVTAILTVYLISLIQP